MLYYYILLVIINYILITYDCLQTCFTHVYIAFEHGMRI